MPDIFRGNLIQEALSTPVKIAFYHTSGSFTIEQAGIRGRTGNRTG